MQVSGGSTRPRPRRPRELEVTLRQQDLKGSVKFLLTVVCHLKWGSEHQEKRPAPRKRLSGSCSMRS